MAIKTLVFPELKSFILLILSGCILSPCIVEHFIPSEFKIFPNSSTPDLVRKNIKID